MHLHTLLYNKCSTFAITAIGLLLITACSHVSRNGLIDGRWRLHEIHSKATPTDAYYTAQKKYVLNDRIYWSFQLDLLQITSSLAHNGQTNKPLPALTMRATNWLCIAPMPTFTITIFPLPTPTFH